MLAVAPFSEDIIDLGADGIRQIWHDNRLRGRGYAKAVSIVGYRGTAGGKIREVPSAENALKISGIGDKTLSGIIAEMGDAVRFDEAKGIQELSGLGLVACSSGKHKGETKISHRGRKLLRYWMFQGAKSVVVHDEHFRQCTSTTLQGKIIRLKRYSR